MTTLTLQQEEAEALERLLDLILTNEAASNAALPDGAQRRAVRRVSKKLHWSRLRDQAPLGAESEPSWQQEAESRSRAI